MSDRERIIQPDEIDQVAHDVANLLTAIAGRATWLRRRGGDAEQDKSLRIIEQAADDAMQVLRRLHPGVAVMRREVNDVRQFISDAVELVRTRSNTEPVTLHVDLGDTSLSAETSAVELREALVNVLNNALDAMPHGGTLRVRAASVGREIRIEIEDNGDGMTPEVAAQAFDPYFSTKGSQGSGLGLSVARTILERHGGRLVLDTRPGAGTTISFFLPIR